MSPIASAAGRKALPADHGPRYAPLVVALAAVCAGIIVDRFWPISAVGWWILAAVALATAAALRYADRMGAASVFLCTALAGLGGAWHHAWWHLYPRNEIAGCLGRHAECAMLEAVVLCAPRHVSAPPENPLKAVPTGERSRFQARLVGIRNGPTWEHVSGNAQVFVDGRMRGIAAGDRVRIAGAVSGPSLPQNPGDVDFAAYARADRRLTFVSVRSPECIRVVGRSSPWYWRRWLDGVRMQGNRLLWEHIDPQRAGLAAALLLGAREQLDEERTAAFVRTNTIHILAISGMHVAILAGCLFYALRLGATSPRVILAGIAVATILYTLLTDAPPSAVRAMVLVLLVCLAMATGRNAAVFNCWAAGGLAVLALNPADLFRAGTQLSFLAVGAMAWIAQRSPLLRPRDPLELLIFRTRPWPVRVLWAFGRSTMQAMLVTVAIWLATAPLVAGRFHLVSPVGVLLTTLLIVPVAVALMSGFATMLLGAICSPAASLFGVVCDGSLWVIDSCIAAASQLPSSYFWVPGPDNWWIGLFYAGLAAFVIAPRRHAMRFVQLGGVLLAVGLVPLAALRTDRDSFRCTFLSVGHGTSVLLQTPDGKAILYDAGKLNSPAGAARSIANALWAEGIMRLDAVVLSHADVDHYNALPDLLQQFGVARLYVSPVMFRDDVEPLRVLRAAIRQSGVPLVELSAGSRLRIGVSTEIRVLHPPSNGVSGSDNAQSLVLAVECCGRRILLPGDLESPGTEALLAQAPWDSDVLLAPHHGSPRSDPPGFSAWSRPEVVVVSGGHAEQAEAVAGSYSANGAWVLHTARDGAVKLVLKESHIAAFHWHNGRWDACRSGTSTSLPTR